MDAHRYRRAMDLIQIAGICGLLPKISPEERTLLNAAEPESSFAKRLKEAFIDASRIYEIAAQTPTNPSALTSQAPPAPDTSSLSYLIREAWNEVISTHPRSIPRKAAMASLNYQNEWCFIRFLSLYRYPFPKDFEINAMALDLLRKLNKIAAAIGGRGRTYNHRAGRKLYPQSTSEVVTEEWLARQIAEGFFRSAGQSEES